MKLFAKSPPLGLRLFLAITASIVLILTDGRSHLMISLRNSLETAVGGLYYIAHAPRNMLDNVSNNFIDTNRLVEENKQLRLQLREKNGDLLILTQLKAENQRLRTLLSSPLRKDEHKKISEVLTSELDSFRQQVVIDRGSQDNAFLGQPVIDEKGVVGQVISVSSHNSRVLLLTDVTSAIPVQNLRNDVRMIASGTGRSDELTLDNLPNTVDVKVGDILVTSGLGGRFPESYPVAVVKKVVNYGNSQFASITATPLASLNSLRYLLLIWPTERNEAARLSPEGVREMYRLRHNQTPLDKLEQNKKAPVPDDEAVAPTAATAPTQP